MTDDNVGHGSVGLGQISRWTGHCLLTGKRYRHVNQSINQSINQAPRSTQPSIPPWSVNPACLAVLRRDVFTYVGKKVTVTLCDPIWLVIPRSTETAVSEGRWVMGQWVKWITFWMVALVMDQSKSQ